MSINNYKNYHKSMTKSMVKSLTGIYKIKYVIWLIGYNIGNWLVSLINKVTIK